MTEFLGQEMKGASSAEVTGVGGGSVNGSTRKQLVEQIEKLREAVLGKALELYPDQQARPVIVWPQMDNLSAAWLLSYPGPHNGRPAMAFSEAVCSHICLPSPACRDRVGEKVGKAVVDLYGDKVMATTLQGDT